MSKNNTAKLSVLFPPLFTVNEYVFMVQARGIQIRDIGAQVLEQVVRGAYSINGTGKNVHIDTLLIYFDGNAVSTFVQIKKVKQKSCCRCQDKVKMH